MTGLRNWRRSVAVVGALAMVATACGGDGDDGGPAAGGGETAATDDGGETAAADDGETTDGSETAAGGDAACGEPREGVKESIVAGTNNPNYASQLAVALADERGYFEDEGITEVEILETDDYIPGLIGGSIDITQADTDVTLGSAQASGEDITILGTYRHKEYQILGVREGIEEPEDLKGADLTGGALGGRNQLILERIVSELGLDPETDVNFVPQGGNSDATLQAIIGGTVDGGALFPRHKFALEEAGGQFLYEEFADLPQETIAVMGDYLEENRPTVMAYLCATLRARQDMYDMSQKDEILGIMRDRGYEIPEEFEGVYDLEVEQISQDGGFVPEEMDELVEEQQQLENLPEDIDWREYVDLGPLHEVQDALGLERRPESLD